VVLRPAELAPCAALCNRPIGIERNSERSTSIRQVALPGKFRRVDDWVCAQLALLRSDTSDDIRAAARTHMMRRLVAPMAADMTRRGSDRPELRAAVTVAATMGVNLGRALGWFDDLKTVPREELAELIAAMIDGQQPAQNTGT
jgi:hypothetical protein